MESLSPPTVEKRTATEVRFPSEEKSDARESPLDVVGHIEVVAEGGSALGVDDALWGALAA